MQDNFCVECNKEFRSQAGLNGHNQWTLLGEPLKCLSESRNNLM